MRTRYDSGAKWTIGGLVVWLVIVVALGIGWIENIIKIAHSDFGSLSGVLVLRIVGIFVVPLGSIMGYFI
jgi:hypothetical protein